MMFFQYIRNVLHTYIVDQAKRYADSIDNAVWTNQFDNTANRRAHIETTGPEIWEQTNGTVNAVTFSTGTGGTLAGNEQYTDNHTATHMQYSPRTVLLLQVQELT